MSLRWRIAVGLAVIAGIVCAFAATGAYLTTKRQLQNSVDESLVARTRDANDDRGPGGGRPRPGPGPGFGNQGCPQPGELQPASAAQLVAEDGTITQCILGGPTLPVTDVGFQTLTIDGTEYRMLTSPWHEGGVIQIARDLDEINAVLGSLRIRLLLLALAGVAAAAALGWWLARRIVRPVVKLRDTAEQIASTQDLTTPIPADGDGEVGSLARSFTTMVDTLATSRAQQQRLITDASHEMRTPLTSLRTNIEVLGRADQMPTAQRAEVLDALQLEVGELSELVAELVELATDSSKAEAPEPVVLADLATDVAARAIRRWGREVSVTTDGDAEPILGQPAQLERRDLEPRRQRGQVQPRGLARGDRGHADRRGRPRPRAGHRARGSASRVRPLLPLDLGSHRARVRAGSRDRRADRATPPRAGLGNEPTRRRRGGRLLAAVSPRRRSPLRFESAPARFARQSVLRAPGGALRRPPAPPSPYDPQRWLGRRRRSR